MLSENNRTERRKFFRVDDVISVIANPVDLSGGRDEMMKLLRSSKAYSLMDIQKSKENLNSENPFDDSENRKLYDMMAHIESKLDFIINHFLVEKECFAPADRKMANISASGIRFAIDKPVNPGDLMELKLLLPAYPPVTVFAYGEVQRIKELNSGKYEIALEYINLGESVKNEIIQYTLNFERDSIRHTIESREDE